MLRAEMSLQYHGQSFFVMSRKPALRYITHSAGVCPCAGLFSVSQACDFAVLFLDTSMCALDPKI